MFAFLTLIVICSLLTIRAEMPIDIQMDAYTFVQRTHVTCLGQFTQDHSMSDNIHVYYFCLKSHWHKCLHKQLFHQDKLQNFTTSLPCMRLQLLMLNAERIVHMIRVFPAFQVQLRVIRFNLKRSLFSCGFHEVWVGTTTTVQSKWWQMTRWLSILMILGMKSMLPEMWHSLDYATLK